MEWLWTPHTVTWQPKRDSRRSGTANDGTENSLTPAATLSVFVEPKTAIWAAEAYGVEDERQPHLVIGNADEMAKLVKGDLLMWNGQELEVAVRFTIHRYGDGYEHGEGMAWRNQTGGRAA